MRIIVIDDYVSATQNVRDALEPVGHKLAICTNPSALDETLRKDTDFDLALVDMDFGGRDLRGRREHTGGLGCMLSLSEVRPKPIPFIIYSSESEDNRLLFYFTAAWLFNPVSLLDKSATREQILAEVTAFGASRGSRRFPEAYRPSRRRNPPVMRGLIQNETHLRIWRSLTQPLRGKKAVAEAAHVNIKTVDDYLIRGFDSVLALEEFSFGPTSHDEETSALKRRLLERSLAFAARHSLFFNDPALQLLVTDKSYWR